MVIEDLQRHTSNWGSYRHVNNAHKLDFHHLAPHGDESHVVGSFESQTHQLDQIDEICHVDCSSIGNMLAC